MVALTERFLSDAGGWQAMKEARSLHAMGRVLTATYEPPMLEGRVREGQTEYRAGLKILSKSNVENICSCRASRQRGMICAHSLAVGVAVLQPKPPAASEIARTNTATADHAATFTTQTRHHSFSPHANGPSIELSIILPPNFAAAWDKDSLTVGAEVLFDGRRVLLGTLASSGAYRCDPADAAVIEKLCALNDGEPPGVATVNRDTMADLLAVLMGHPRVTFGREKPARIKAAEKPLELMLRRDASTGALNLHVAIPPDARTLAATRSVWALRDDEKTIELLVSEFPASYSDIFKKEVTVPAEQVSRFVAQELPLLTKFFEVTGDPLPEPEPEPAPRFAAYFEGSLNFLTARLEAIRGERRLPITSRNSGNRSGAEADAIQRLRSAGFIDGRDDLFELRGERAIVRFFATDFPRLQRDWEVSVGARFAHVTRDFTRIEPRLDIQPSGESWFDLSVELATGSGGERFSATELQRLIQSGQNSVKLRNGKTAVFDGSMLDELQEVIADCAPQQPQPGRYRISKRYASYLEGVASYHGLAVRGLDRASSGALLRMEKLAPIALGSLETLLRPYQKVGVSWFSFLASNDLGGILADEMGLGKTVQTLAFLRQLPGTSLVVCPSALLVNWQREVMRFTPERKCLVIEGSGRAELFKEIKNVDLVITSYALLRRDVAVYAGFKFAAVVLDEAQHIKNPESQNAQSALSLRAEHRFVLTGTPIENSLRDIWSIMQFVMPGYLGTRVDFKERYEDPIRNDPSGPQHRRLIQRLSPFVLRRLKKTVAPELPKKIEQVAYCELTTTQRALYNGLLAAARDKLTDVASSKRPQQARMLILTALLRLRQAVCDIRLLDQDAATGRPISREPSAKVELLRELLAEAIDGGHRVIVFSQFVSMLAILREELDAMTVQYAYLDGSTRDRQAVVDQFQAGSAPVFLMSLKAGGVGLNVTAADTVIHFDPWWNPAVEAQATDRAHRIGQTKVVTAYKLIARDTVEEKILSLQERKRSLVDATMSSEEEPLMEGLSMAEITSLFE
jgi:superfamily II DNA or RNA helicase